jgi:hypothetical protein
MIDGTGMATWQKRGLCDAMPLLIGFSPLNPCSGPFRRAAPARTGGLRERRSRTAAAPTANERAAFAIGPDGQSDHTRHRNRSGAGLRQQTRSKRHGVDT